MYKKVLNIISIIVEPNCHIGQKLKYKTQKCKPPPKIQKPKDNHQTQNKNQQSSTTPNNNQAQNSETIQQSKNLDEEQLKKLEAELEVLQQRYKEMKKSTKIGLGIGIQDEKAWDKKLVIKKNK